VRGSVNEEPKTAVAQEALHATHAAQVGMRVMASVELDESDQPERDAQDGDSVPQPIEDWADDGDANRWLHEHHFDGAEHFDIN
jgi:hypothetical protein